MKIKSMIKFSFPKLMVLVVTLGFITCLQTSCKKLVEIRPPVTSISTTQVFADSVDATSAIEGIYSQMLVGPYQISNGAATIFCGMSADELLPFQSQGNNFPTNTLLNGDTNINSIWSTSYSLIYQVNASIEGVSASRGLTQATKNQLIGEAKFVRAFYYFYLVNLFGDVPLITTSDYKVNSLAARTPQAKVYAAIINDLLAAQSLLPKDYSYSGGARIRANSLAATALLARVYLFQGQWNQAENQASTVIANTSLFSLSPDLRQVFNAGSNEAILQLNPNTNFSPFNATQEGLDFVTNDSLTNPIYYLRQEILNAFEPSDNRKQVWLGKTTYSGVTYFYPYKYVVGPNQEAIGVPAPQYYTLLRLAEQYLIRAEAEANGAPGDAVADLNVIRNRAGLPDYSGPMDKQSLLSAIAHENQVEFFAEFGHRWLDLKRTGQVNTVLSKIKPTWKSYQQLYPIPYAEIHLDPNLTQNQGYY